MAEVCASSVGRAKDYALNGHCRRAAGVELLTGMRRRRRYVETGRNPSDGDSRLADAGLLLPGQHFRGAAVQRYIGDRAAAAPRGLRGAAASGPALLELGGGIPRFTAVDSRRGFRCALPLLFDGTPSLRDAAVQRRALTWITSGLVSFVWMVLPGGGTPPFVRRAAVRFITACVRRCGAFAVPFALVGARHDPDWRSAELGRARRGSGALTIDLDYCQYGSPVQRPTRLVGTLGGLGSLARRCCCLRHGERLTGRARDRATGRYAWRSQLARRPPAELCQAVLDLVGGPRGSDGGSGVVGDPTFSEWLLDLPARCRGERGLLSEQLAQARAAGDGPEWSTPPTRLQQEEGSAAGRGAIDRSVAGGSTDAVAAPGGAGGAGRSQGRLAAGAAGRALDPPPAGNAVRRRRAYGEGSAAREGSSGDGAAGARCGQDPAAQADHPGDLWTSGRRFSPPAFSRRVHAGGDGGPGPRPGAEEPLCRRGGPSGDAAAPPRRPERSGTLEGGVAAQPRYNGRSGGRLAGEHRGARDLGGGHAAGACPLDGVRLGNALQEGVGGDRVVAGLRPLLERRSVGNALGRRPCAAGAAPARGWELVDGDSVPVDGPCYVQDGAARLDRRSGGDVREEAVVAAAMSPLRDCRRAPGDRRLFPLQADEMQAMLTDARRRAGLRPTHLHRLRHGGASVGGIAGVQDSVMMDRGSWSATRSLLRYRRPARYLRQLAALKKEQVEKAQSCGPRILGAVLAGLR